MANIAIAGFQHETNSISPIKTTLNDFLISDCWPEYSEGNDLIKNLSNMNIPISGFIEQAKTYNFNLKPLLWCSAIPSGKVEQDTYEKITNKLYDELKKCKNLDAIYLDLHGAMVTEKIIDPEGDILENIRKITGNIPIIVSLDLHANISKEMLDFSDILLCYKTYPHIDMKETGIDCANILNKILANKDNFKQKQIIKIPFQIPLPFQSTMQNPAKTIYENINNLENKEKLCISFAQAFPLSNNKHCYPTLIGYGKNKEILDKSLIEIENLITKHQKYFNNKIWNYKQAITYAISKTYNKPMIISDTQDNPGGGSSSDVVEIIKELAKQNAKNSIVAIIHDKNAADIAHKSGINSNIEISLGGKTNVPNQSPLNGIFKVKKINNGNFIGTGPFYKNCNINLGKMALLEYKGIDIIISSKKMQAADKAIFHHLEIDPTTKSILCLKSSVHFRADFEDIASEILIANAPGLNYTTVN